MSNFLLFLMLLSYSIPIFYVYYNYSNNTSVSNIICQDNCQKIILLGMLLMGYFSILYEINRGGGLSLLLIILILIGIYGVILIKEDKKIHYMFAAIVFLSIIGFMINHCIITNCNFLYLLLYIQIILLFITILNIETNIFYSELLLIVNFAIYYLYLHYISP
jgi:hypothetical protein